jgi:hypothetical protein
MLGRAYRFGVQSTPTPPPVTLTIAPDGSVLGGEGPDGERAGEAQQEGERVEPSGRASGGSKRRGLRRLLTLAFVAGLLAAGIGGWRVWPDSTLQTLAHWSGLENGAVDRAAAAALLAGTAAVASARTPTTAPFRIRHAGYVPIDGGLLIAPDGFEPDTDGSYDLLVFFHGDVGVVRESVEYVRLNAALAIINLGVMSGVYRDAYSGRGLYEDLLDQIDRALVERGLPEPKRRRVALAAWSAGYAAIGSILRNREGQDWLDAILVFDGIHAGWRVEAPDQMNPRPLAPFVDVARSAAQGKMLFSIAHSEIEPPSFAGSRDTATYLLRSVGARPDEDVMLELPPHLQLRAAANAVSKRREKRMVPYSDTHVGDLRVRGYRGDTREHHMAHLLQMAATALPDLADRWGRSPRAVARAE